MRPPRTEPDPLLDLEGTYVGRWQSNQGFSGLLTLTVTVGPDALISAEAVLTGSPVGYRGDRIAMVVTDRGDGLATVRFEGIRSKLSGTGIFRGRTFTGDYRYIRWLLGVDDRGLRTAEQK